MKKSQHTQILTVLTQFAWQKEGKDALVFWKLSSLFDESNYSTQLALKPPKTPYKNDPPERNHMNQAIQQQQQQKYKETRTTEGNQNKYTKVT